MYHTGKLSGAPGGMKRMDCSWEMEVAPDLDRQKSLEELF